VETTIPCPGCKTELNLADPGCPVCLRGRSAQEIARGYARVRAEDVQRRRRPFVALAYFVAAAAVACAGIEYREPILDVMHRLSAKAAHFYDQNSDPAYIAPHYKPQAPAAPADSRPAEPNPSSAPLSAPAPTPGSMVPPAIIRRIASPAPAVAAPRLAAAEPPLPHAEPSQWILHGRVYDLATLEPIAGAQLTAKTGDAGGPFFTANADGYYAVVLPRSTSDNSGYGLENRDPRYATEAQFESDIPYRSLPAEDRTRLIRNAQENELHPGPIVDIAGEESRQRDVFLSPRR
jgi:hypothetical protein